MVLASGGSQRETEAAGFGRRLAAGGSDGRGKAERQGSERGRSKPASKRKQSGVPRRKAASEQSRSRGEGTKARQVKRPPTTVRNVNVDGESEGLCVSVCVFE